MERDGILGHLEVEPNQATTLEMQYVAIDSRIQSNTQKYTLQTPIKFPTALRAITVPLCVHYFRMRTCTQSYQKHSK